MAQRQTMERRDSAMIPPTEQESVVAHLSRSTKNAFYSCFGCLQTSKEKTLIKYKEYEIEQRKKTFGVTYINHKKQGQDDLLPECVETALTDIRSFETEINELKAKVATKDEETKSRLLPAPGTPVTGSNTKPSTTMAVQETAVTPSPPEASMAPSPPDASMAPSRPAASMAPDSSAISSPEPAGEAPQQSPSENLDSASPSPAVDAPQAGDDAGKSGNEPAPLVETSAI